MGIEWVWRTVDGEYWSCWTKLQMWSQSFKTRTPALNGSFSIKKMLDLGRSHSHGFKYTGWDFSIQKSECCGEKAPGIPGSIPHCLMWTWYVKAWAFTLMWPIFRSVLRDLKTNQSYQNTRRKSVTQADFTPSGAGATAKRLFSFLSCPQWVLRKRHDPVSYWSEIQPLAQPHDKKLSTRQRQTAKCFLIPERRTWINRQPCVTLGS